MIRRLVPALLAAFVLVLGPVVPGTSAVAASSADDYVTRTVQLVNDARRSAGLPALAHSPRLSAIAEDWSGRMAATGSFVHNPSFSAQYPSGWRRASENIAYGWSTGTPSSAADLHAGFMDSSGHRANILDSRATHIGVGVAFVTRAGRNYVYLTQNFAAYPSGAGPDRPEQRAVDRLSGQSRFETAVQIGAAAFPASDEVVIVAGAQASIVDGLVAAPFAYHREAPMLLSGRDALGSVTVAEIRRRDPSRAWLIGGSGVLGAAVERELRSLGVTDVRRLSGDDRYGTAARIAREMPAGDAVIASGATLNLIDAAAVSGPAAASGVPVLLTAPDRVPPSVAAALRDRGTRSVTIVGGTGSVRESVARDLRGRGIQVTRVGGADRFATAAGIATRFVDATGTERVVVASGANGNLIDAMTGGVLGQAVLLTAGTTPPSVTRRWVVHNDVGEVVAVGGTGAIPAIAVDILRTAT